MERANDAVAIEVKAGRQVTPADTRGLLSLAELTGRRRRLALWVAFRGERAQRFESGVEASWRIVDPILNTDQPVYEYDCGSAGPVEAERMAAGGGGWIEPSVVCAD